MIDWHTHILPDMDDGSKDVEESIAMLKLCQNQGVTTVVLTPHFYPHRDEPEHFLKRRNRSMEELNKNLMQINQVNESKTPLPKLILGAEVYFFPELAVMEKKQLQSLCLGKSSYLMVELPVETWTKRVYQSLESMIYNRGIRPVIAHIDRYFHYIKDIGPLKELIDMGVLVQLNTEALEGFLARRKAIKWIDAGYVHLLGSDCHNMEDRKPNLDWGYKILGDRWKEKIIYDI
ncbi:MAG: hypothetical protein PHR60_03075 [Eubacteriales bacterium]|nr:hypothetical protein [Eubacteriales bacterium]